MFKEKLNKKLVNALLEYGIETPRELQLKCLSRINSGADLIGIAPENMGKSTLIMIGAINKLKEAFEDAPRALILVASMEKALAMKQQFELLAKETSLRAECAYEEGKINEQNEAIYSGTDLVIGTPKRVLEIYFNKNLNLNKIKLFVIDDAETMIKNAWQGQVDRLGLSLPKCQHLVFTENFNEKIEKLIHKFMIAPTVVEVSG
ncbi:MAG TPA: DEAD/DEAH box helicase [Bacteroidia bacterium]|nr:DEAD/DEAH box helicase [Bacteroidia bacterium]